MPYIKLGEYKIDSERLGFPANVNPTAEQAGEKIDEVLKERDALRTDRDEWRGKAEAGQAEVRSLRNAQEKLNENECDLFLEKAKNALKIDAVMIPSLKEMWKKDGGPKLVRDMVDLLRAKAYLAEERGLKGSATEVDPEAEVMAKAAELVANDKTQKMSMSDAQFKVLADNPELSRRYRESKVVGARKGGDQ